MGETSRPDGSIRHRLSLEHPVRFMDRGGAARVDSGRVTLWFDVAAGSDRPGLDSALPVQECFAELVAAHGPALSARAFQPLLFALSDRFGFSACGLSMSFNYPLRGAGLPVRFFGGLTAEDFHLGMGLSLPVENSLADLAGGPETGRIEVEVRLSGLLWIEDLVELTRAALGVARSHATLAERLSEAGRQLEKDPRIHTCRLRLAPATA